MNSKIFDVDLITSKANSTIVKISKLLNKKGRREERLFLCDGIKLFEEALDFGAQIKYIILKENALFSDTVKEKILKCKSKGVHILCVTDSVFLKLTEEAAPQGIICVCEFIDNQFDESEADLSKKVIALESIRDPGNLGTIIRNAAAFGVNYLILSSDCVDIYSSKVIRASMGAIFKVKIIVASNFVQSLEKLKEMKRRIISLTLGNNSLVLGKNVISKSDVFVIGNEGHGISEDTVKISSETMFIPMQENTESLNAAIATTIVMWELYK